MKDLELSKKVAQNLLEIKAIKLSPENPFTWASGIRAPIYCDNRKVLSYPKARKKIKKAFVEIIKKQFKNIDIIAGVATGAIAHGVIVAEALNLPFVYVRSSPKGHGLENMIEGDINVGNNVLVIEDLISTGGSSLQAVSALRKANKNVLGLMAIFSYGFDEAQKRFDDADCLCITLSDYNVLIEEAQKTGYINSTDIDSLNNWRKDPKNWKK